MAMNLMSPMNLSITNILAGLIFGAVGFVAFMYGKKQALAKPMVLGVALMAYPYFITSTVAVVATGLILTALLFVFND